MEGNMSEALAHNMDPELLVQRYLADPRPDLKDLILVHYSGLVERIARRFAGVEPLEDLVQVGFIGLLNALSKFDAQAGVRFNTYATHLVAGEIKHYLRDRSQTIRQPAWLQELRHKVNRGADLLQARLGRAPSEREIAEHLGVSEAAVLEVLQSQEMLKVGSLDSPGPVEEDGESDGIDTGAPCVQQLTVEDRVVLGNAIRQLRELEQQVLVLFHFEAVSQTEIAHRLGISCNYVSHILRQSLAKLRRILGAEEEQEEATRREIPGADLVDVATGLYSEEYMRQRLQEETHRAASRDESFGLVLIELGGMGRLASYYGEAYARDVIAEFAEVLRSNTRRLDVVGRFGRAGFALILGPANVDTSAARLRIEGVVREWLGHRGIAQTVSIRIGHSAFPDEASHPSELIESATRRLMGETASAA